MSDQQLAILNQYPKDKFNVLAPETMSTITPWHQVIVTQVKISPNKDDGEVYPQQGKLALTKIGLMRLSDAAGIRWQRPTFMRDPEDGSVDCVAIAEKQDVDGTWRQYPGAYRWDVTERLKECDEGTQQGKANARMIRTFAMQRAESGAMERAIRAVLGVKSVYTPSDLAKPFIVARVSFNPYSDPLVQAAFRQALTVNLLHNMDLLGRPAEGGDPLGIDGPAPAPRVTGRQLGVAAQTLAALGEGNGDEGDGDNGPDWDQYPEAEEEQPAAHPPYGDGSPVADNEKERRTFSEYTDAVGHVPHSKDVLLEWYRTTRAAK